MKKRLISLIAAMLIFTAASFCAFSAYAAESAPASQSVRSSIGANEYHMNYNSQMAVGTKQQIQVIISSGQSAPDPSFRSSNNSVATVTSKGVVTAKGTGSVNITYSPDGNSSKSISINVKAMPSSISLASTNRSLNEGQSFNLNAKLNSSAYPCKIRYTSSNSNIASVSSSGTVTAKGEGKAVITAITENGVRATCTVYVYSNSGISLNKNSAKVAMDYDNVEKVIYGTSVRGRDLEAYIINGSGNNSKTIFCTFAVHGFEDNYAHDGKVLVECANDLISYFAKNPSYLKDYRIVIVPCANPDGTIDGVNNLRTGSSAFGRCTAAHVDMNRDFISGQFRAQESRALRDLMKKYKMNTFIDFHGWLNSVLGNGTLVDIFRSTNGISRDQTGTYGTSSGYIFGWANANLGARSALVEFKSPSACNYLNVAKGIQRAVDGSYHPSSSSSIVYEYSGSIPAVNNVRSTSVSTDNLALKWDSVSGAKGYQIQFSKDGVNWSSTEVFGSTSITIKGLDPGVAYKFRVRGFTYSGNVRTYSTHFSSWVTINTKPDSVSGFKASGRSSDGSGIILNWTQKLNADGYNIYQSKNGSWVKIATLEGSMSANYRVPTTANSKYSFAIEAYKGSSSNTGARATYTTYSSAPAPDNFTANAVSANKIRVTWSAKSGVGCYIQIATDSAFTKNVETFYVAAGKSSYEISTKQYSKNYYVRIRSCRVFSSEEICGGYSGAVSTANSLFRPENLKVYARGDGGTDLYLSWNKVSDADGYNIYIVSGGKRILKGTTDGTRFTFTDLTASYVYDVVVEAYNSKAKSSSLTTSVCAAPAQVQEVSASLTDSGSVTVSWSKTSCHGYYIQWAANSTFTSHVNGVYVSGNSKTSYTIDLPSNAQNYYVRVRAYKDYNSERIGGDYSEALRLRGLMRAANGFHVYARGDGGTDLYLDWNDVSGADGYRVYIVSGNTDVFKGTTTSSRFTFTDLVPSWEYDVKVVAYNDDSRVTATYRICAAPAQVKNVSANAVGNKITASWSSTTSHGYLIQWSTSENFSTVVGSATVNGSDTKNYTINVSDPEKYYVRVRAWKSFSGSTVYGDFSSAQAAVVKPGAPGGYNVYARGDGGTDLYLEWNRSTDADGYRVYILSGDKEILKGTTSGNRFTFTDLTPSWEYKVMVVAFNENGSASSKTTVCAAPSSVEGLSVQSEGDTLRASWSGTTCHGYLIQWSASENFSTVAGSAVINGSDTTDYTLKVSDAGDYYVRVRAWKNYSGSQVFGDFCAPENAAG